MATTGRLKSVPKVTQADSVQKVSIEIPINTLEVDAFKGASIGVESSIRVPHEVVDYLHNKYSGSNEMPVLVFEIEVPVESDREKELKSMIPEMKGRYQNYGDKIKKLEQELAEINRNKYK